MTRQSKAYLAEAFICIVWGTTYLAIKVGVKHYPPFLFAGVRQVLAGVILMGVALFLNKQRDLSSRNLRQQMLIGFLMLTLGNGFVTLGMRWISSGVAALICSMMPLFAVLFNLASAGKDKFNGIIGAGLLLGVCGVGLIFRHNIADLGRSDYLGGILVTLIATCSWALGSILNRRNTTAVNPFLNSGMQLFFGGAFMLMISPFTDNYAGMQLWNTEGIWSLVYLVTFGSVMAYAAYMYALSELPVAMATIYAYINPLIAVLAGYFVLHEDMNLFTVLAFITIVIGVYLVNYGYRKQAIKKESTSGSFPESAPVES